MHQHSEGPLTWLEHVASALQWPVVVTGAFWLGRYVKDLEHRVHIAEKRLTDLVERHFPTVHKALAEINGKVSTLLALMTQRGK